MEKSLLDRNNLDMAYELKVQANQHYEAGEYGNAILLYHRCLLHAKAVAQLSNLNLRELARDERQANTLLPPSSSKASFSQNDCLPSKSDECENFEEVNSKKLLDEPADSLKGNIPKKRSRIDSTTRGEEMKKEARQLVSECYKKLAACIVNGPLRKRDDYLRAVFYCDKVLELESINEKVIFCKGCAFEKAELYNKAIEQFEKCNDHEESKLKIEQCVEKLAENRKRRDATIRANFEKAHQAQERRNLANGVMNGNALNDNLNQ